MYDRAWLVCLMRNLPPALLRDKTKAFLDGCPVYPTIDLAGRALHEWPVDLAPSAGLGDTLKGPSQLVDSIVRCSCMPFLTKLVVACFLSFQR